MNIRVTMAQIPVYAEICRNVSTIKEAVMQAAADKADILLTPEGSLSGYSHLHDAREADEALAEITAYARDKHVGLALGTCKFENDGKCYNELRFYLPNGDYLGCHTKTLLCGSSDDIPKGEIEHFSVMPLRTFDFMGITVGGLICNDMWANPSCTPMDDPHLTRQLAKMGAQVIFQAVNGGREDSDFSQKTVKRFHEDHVLMKANADHVYIATVDNAFPMDIGVSSIGGVVSPDGWEFQLIDKGCHIESHTIDLSRL